VTCEHRSDARVHPRGCSTPSRSRTDRVRPPGRGVGSGPFDRSETRFHDGVPEP
jgi:hypothetical protein